MMYIYPTILVEYGKDRKRIHLTLLYQFFYEFDPAAISIFHDCYVSPVCTGWCLYHLYILRFKRCQGSVEAFYSKPETSGSICGGLAMS